MSGVWYGHSVTDCVVTDGNFGGKVGCAEIRSNGGGPIGGSGCGAS